LATLNFQTQRRINEKNQNSLDNITSNLIGGRMKYLYPKPIKKDGVWYWMLQDDNLISMTPTEEAIFKWLEGRINWILREIEKERVKSILYRRIRLDEPTLLWVKKLIKRAFSEVLIE